MRFSVAVVALAGAVSAYEYPVEQPPADSTVYSTDYVTVTSCGAYVTDCPADSTVVSSTVYPVTTSTAAPYYPSKYQNSTSAAVPTYPPKGDYPASYPPVYPPVSVSSAAPVYPPVYPPISISSAAPACPTYSVKTVVEDVTTVIQTTKYETVDIPCPTPSPSAGYPVPPANGTATYVAPPPTYTAGASTMGASVFLAAAAGLAALLL